MKKGFYLLLVTLLFVGCGGGGTTTSGLPNGGSGGGTGGDGSGISGPVGYITVNFPGSSAPEPNVPVRTGGLATIAGLRDHFRVVVRQVGIVTTEDEEGNPISFQAELRRFVQDNTIPGSLRFVVPPGDNYTVEVLTYDQVPPINYMLEYWKSGLFSVLSGVNTPLTPTLNPLATSITMTAPDNVVSGFGYTVSITKTVPLRPQYFLSQHESTSLWPAIPDFVVGYGAVGAVQRTLGSVSFTAPTVSAQSNLYLQGQFFIDDSLLNDAERSPATPPSWSYWRINCPNPAYTDNVVSVLLLPGTFTITF